jgi:hypothetical protein
MEKIELSDKEKEVIKKQLNGEITQFSATPEERTLLMGVISKAEALLDELDDYDNMGDDLIQWFWGKYQSQK